MGENLFEEEFTIDALSQMGNPLERLAALVDFEMFRPALEEVLVKKDCKTPAGRPQIDVVLLFLDAGYELQKHYLWEAHEKGIGPRALSRLTGVPYSIVQRATSAENERTLQSGMVCESTFEDEDWYSYCSPD